jgi:sulfur carrier protein
MQIIINGEPTNVSEQLTALQLLQNLGIAERKLALEVNETIIPRSNLSQYIIQAGDAVEIIHAIGGG